MSPASSSHGNRRTAPRISCSKRVWSAGSADVLVVDRNGADEGADHLRDTRRPYARRVDDRLALDRPMLGLYSDDTPVAHVDAGDERLRADLDPELARRRRDGIRRDMWIDVAVARHPHGAVQ